MTVQQMIIRSAPADGLLVDLTFTGIVPSIGDDPRLTGENDY